MSDRALVASLVVAYLAVIVGANLSVATWGPAALALTAWVLIPFDMTAKDSLQLIWIEKGRLSLTLKLAALIGAGALLTWLIFAQARTIAIASCVAFACAATLDAIVFQVTRKRLSRLKRVNTSNLVAFVADSVIFQTLAFGAFDPWVGASQIGAKTVGGFVWSIVIARTLWRTETFARLQPEPTRSSGSSRG